MLQEQKQMGNAFYEQYELNLETQDAVGWYAIPKIAWCKAKGEKFQKDLAIIRSITQHKEYC